MGLIRKAAKEMLESLMKEPSPSEPAGPLPKDEIEKVVSTVRAEFVAELSYLQSQLAFYKRRSEDYFVLIEKMQTQRDEWHDIHMAESRGHQGAQVVLQEALVTSRQYLGKAITMLNAHLEEKHLPPIVSMEDLAKMDAKAPPVGLAEATKAHNERVLAAAAPLLDGLAERTKIDETIGDPPVLPEPAAEPPSIQNT